jgi:ribosomal protein S6--L-glutamate ligase
MVETLIVVNGEDFWDSYFPDYDVYHVRLQTSRWLLHNGQLTVFDTSAGKAIRVDRVLWRGAPVRPFPNHRAVLELIRFARVPCLNSATVLLQGLERISMLTELHEIGLPVTPFTAAIGPLMGQIQPTLPAVIKIGNYHAGYGKMLLSTLEQWQDMKDFVYITIPSPNGVRKKVG